MKKELQLVESATDLAEPPLYPKTNSGQAVRELSSFFQKKYSQDIYFSV